VLLLRILIQMNAVYTYILLFFRSLFRLSFHLCLGVHSVLFYTEMLSDQDHLCVSYAPFACMHAYSRRADIVQVLIIALFSVTDLTVVK